MTRSPNNTHQQEKATLEAFKSYDKYVLYDKYVFG
ncbi:hypothetical protein L917_08930 [Phytophthora nicotianae]|uniref:Uncharacterized protein n=1 Tax=Phytophthora nicotianae TaxID=4792 RepID=W2L846_PHYNI|nr:hypothetical protein L917_08930 [Phytophthora nicotianae]